MFDPVDPETYWLNITNITLGVVTAVCLIGVGTMVVREVMAKMRKRVQVPAYSDNHLFAFSDLGITMADGGEKVDEKTLRKTDSTIENDGPNIFRSIN
jgi:hypothetical protein